MNLKYKICTIGGGSGMPIINKALVRSGFKSVSSIVTTFDSGGDSGRLRTDERGRILAFSDYWRSLLSLWVDGQQKEVWEEILRYRDGRNRNFGNTFFQFLSEKMGDLSKVDSMFTKLTGAVLRGEVIPVSTSPSNLCFETISGKKYVGEHFLDELRMSNDKVKKIWLEPEAMANIEAVSILKSSDVIIICPGSVYGSILINFLPQGIKEAYVKSKAKKILMTNIVSVANEALCDQNSYVEEFSKYLKTKKPFDLIVMPNLETLKSGLLKKVLDLYSMEHSYSIAFNKKSTIKTIKVDITQIEEVNMRLRHNEEKLIKFFTEFNL